MDSYTAPALAAIVLLAAPLAGCAEYEVVRKCGVHGCSGDQQLSAEVRVRLEEYPALGPPNQVYVQALDRTVYLSGQVATDLQRENAAAIAAAAPGVRRVVDDIALTYSGR